MRWKVWVALLVGGSAYLILFHRRLNWMGDPGFFVAGAQRILDGQVPYRDFFAHFTPSSFYLLSGAMALFGHSYETGQLLWVVLVLVQGGIAMALTWRLTGCVGLSAMAFALVLAPAAISPVYNHHLLSSALALGSTLAWWAWLKSRRLRWTAAAGAADALAFWTSQNKGVLLAAAALIIIFFLSAAERKDRWSAAWVYLSGALAATLPFAAVLALQGSWDAFVSDCFVFVVGRYNRSSFVPYGTMYSELETASTLLQGGRTLSALWYIAGPLIALPTEFILLSRRGRERILTGLLAVHGFALWASSLHRPDFDHLVAVAPWTTILLIAQLNQLSRRPGKLAPIAYGFIFLFSGVATASIGARSFHALTRPSYTIQTPLVRAWTWSPALAETANSLAAYIKARHEPVFAFPHASLYYHALQCPNPTRFDSLVYGFQDPVQIDEILQTLRDRMTEFVIVDTTWDAAKTRGLFPFADVDFASGPFMEFVQSRYREELKLPAATLYRRIQ